VLRQARRRRASESLDVAAPDGRVDVEAPVANDTDSDAQASQFDLGDFGDNASDNIANPDLSTDENWPPAEGKTSARTERADAILAMRCADAFVKCALSTEEEKYNLVSNLQKMSRPTVSMQLRLLDRMSNVMQQKNAEIEQLQLQASRGSTRGARALPPGIGSMSQQRAASVQRVAENDPVNDFALFMS